MTYIAYIRRSKKEQDSSLGIDAQQAAISRYVEQSGGVIIKSFTELESGTARNLKKRVQLFSAIEECKLQGATLIVHKLDRLARDVEFVASLTNSGVKFVCVDNPHATELTINLISAVNQDEARRISERTTAALAEKKRRGEPLGCHAHREPGCKITPEIRSKAVQRIKEKAASNKKNRRAKGYVRSLLSQKMSYFAIARKMQQEGYTSPRGGMIYEETVRRWAV